MPDSNRNFIIAYRTGDNTQLTDFDHIRGPESARKRAIELHDGHDHVYWYVFPFGNNWRDATPLFEKPPIPRDARREASRSI